jgi:hypothetical protein
MAVESTATMSRGATGPRTRIGKKRTRLNAFKHGLCSEKLLLSGESLSELDWLGNELLKEFSPRSASEFEDVTQLTHLYFALRRVPFAEMAELGKVATAAGANRELGRDADFERMEILSARILPEAISDRLARYRTHLNREIDRIIGRLERPQRRPLGVIEPAPLRLEVHE